jgi:ADP-heptose:LPS heptosyltransferase
MNTPERIEAKTKSNRESALAAFITKKAEIDAMLARLTALSDDHFDTNPDEINWGHVGNLGRYASLLKQITDMAFQEGEHAE